MRPTTPAPASAAAWEGTRRGAHGYTECTPGDLPVVISVPHGGALKPPGISDRTNGVKTADVHTIDLARAISEAFRERTSKTPYVVVCQLHRCKLDANRAAADAAEGNADAELAWSEYHAFVDDACADVVKRFGSGIYIDLHGHAHDIARIELGYLLSARDLGESDAGLATSGMLARSSFGALHARGDVDLAEALRGPTSLGGLLSREYACVPSPAAPSPGEHAYFDGGFSTRAHTHALPGLQIEAPLAGVRDTAENRARFGRALAQAVETFLSVHAGISL